MKMLESVGKLADRQAAVSAAQHQNPQHHPGSAYSHSQTVHPHHPQETQKNEEFNTNLYFEHLQEVAGKVSNRVRFLILNLIELRNVSFLFLFITTKCG